MKLIVTGATGLVAQEVLRQGLRNPAIQKIVAVARKPVTIPALEGGVDASKLRSVVVPDYDNYPPGVKEEFSGADACIWTVAITPTKSKDYPFAEVQRICQTSTLVGINAMREAGLGSPFRFIYMSGIAAERDQSKTPPMLPEYSLMRAIEWITDIKILQGETENRVLAFASEHKVAEGFEACVVKPGLITHDAASVARAEDLQRTMGIPNITVEEVAAAMLHQVIHGFEKEPLVNEDLVRIGRKALEDGL
ncbi:succinate-semialdehyde dehydrogenase [Favolaschia claudopus]|uniref:Succinate-semialdehyde dehydrogenase n=1 Tax=Favolaschia claudopus TaxID=2862362 RepID=A0AAW0C240_9AGAR